MSVMPQPMGSAPAQLPMDQVMRQVEDLVRPLLVATESLVGHPVIAYVLKDGSQIADDVYPSFMDIVRNLSANNPTKISVLLHTNGGQAETPYKIMTLLRNYVDEVDVLIAQKALSSGTSFARGCTRRGRIRGTGAPSRS